MGKNIIIFSDGTGQKGGKSYNTNIYKLFNMIEDRTEKQIAYYDAGLGTGMEGVAGLIGGRGFSRNMLDCYRFLFEHFQADDHIYLFGFSRGAATVRSLSGFIHLFGILPISRADIIEEAFDIYKIHNKERREKKAKEFIAKHHTMWCKIKFLGVFDTVAALGLPNKWMSTLLDQLFPHKFHSFELSDSVEYARHALSIDDERKTFHPVLWNKLKEDQPKDRLKQVWFCGVHTDVGGGYKEEELSNITLKWMIHEATSKGLLIYSKSPEYQRFLAAEKNPEGMMHNEQIGFVGKLFRREKRNWQEKTNGKLCVHESVLKRTKNQSNEDSPRYSSWILNYDSKEVEIDS